MLKKVEFNSIIEAIIVILRKDPKSSFCIHIMTKDLVNKHRVYNNLQHENNGSSLYINYFWISISLLGFGE